MLETIREYAGGLLESARRERVAEAHARYFTRLAAGFEALWAESGHDAASGHFLDDLANLRAALSWATAQDPEVALRIGTDLGGFFAGAGLYREAVDLLTRALSAAESASEELRAAAAANLGMLVAELGEDQTRTRASRACDRRSPKRSAA